MADDVDFEVDNDDVGDDGDDGDEGQAEELTEDEVEEQEPELKKEEEEPCDYEVYEDINQDSSLKTTDNSAIQTSLHLSKFEMARVLGVRTEMLNRDAPPLIDIGDCIDTFEIAKRELKAGRCPLIIARPLPSGERVLVRVSSLIVKGI
jgi:DNA-directed RNA polymerase subunit K/omega